MELITSAGLAAFAIYAATKWNLSEEEKIRHTFRNVGYRIKDKEPRLLKRHKTKSHTLYTYSVPYGLVDDPKLSVLSKVLIRPVKVTFTNGKLHVKVYRDKLPTSVTLDSESNLDPWDVVIGKSLDGDIVHNFDRIPHMTVAGMTRYGKTVLIKSLVAQLIRSNLDDVEFYIIDLKGGLEFARYEKLSQVRSVAGNIEEAYRLLTEVRKRIESDMQRFRRLGYTNIIDTSDNKRIFVITDEGAQLTPSKHHTKEEKQMFAYCQDVLSEVCRVAGALGYRNIFCTQYPTADTLPRQIKQNSDAKISFRLPTEVASRVAIDEQGAEELAVPGRAIYRTHDRKEIQVPYISDKQMWAELRRYEFTDENEGADKPARTNTIDIG